MCHLLQLAAKHCNCCACPADEVAQAAGRREQLYQLQPAGPAVSAAACPAGADASPGAANGYAVIAALPIHLAGHQSGVVQQLMAAAAQSLQHSPAFDEVNLK
jgi:hypothetical protein